MRTGARLSAKGGGGIKTIGFIGAGKCGMSLAYYFRSKGVSVSGFSSRRVLNDSGMEFFSREELLKNSGIIFITVTDTAIREVWNGLRKFDLTDKIICHCSGSLSSDIFSGADKDMICSVHPMLAFNSRHTSCGDISRAFFTLEGGKTAVEELSRILDFTGNSHRLISKEHKAEYHAAACFASNFVVSVCEKAEQLLESCGFLRGEAHTALVPLMRNNMDNIIKYGTRKAVTGPAARGDIDTIRKHMEVMGADSELYRLLTDVIFEMKNGGVKNENYNGELQKSEAERR